MSGIRNVFITFFGGSEEEADRILANLKEQVGDFDVIVISHGEIEDNTLSTIKTAYPRTTLMSIDGWDYNETALTIESSIESAKDSVIRREVIVDISNANQLESYITCYLSYIHPIKVYCDKLSGELKTLNDMQVADINKFGDTKLDILKIMVENSGEYSVEDLVGMILMGHGRKKRSLSDKTVRNNVLDLVERGLIDQIKDRRFEPATNRRRNVYSINRTGMATYKAYMQKEGN